jgi:hypothetical protein
VKVVKPKMKSFLSDPDKVEARRNLRCLREGLSKTLKQLLYVLHALFTSHAILAIAITEY